jgi:hypothetical protein
VSDLKALHEAALDEASDFHNAVGAGFANDGDRLVALGRHGAALATLRTALTRLARWLTMYEWDCPICGFHASTPRADREHRCPATPVEAVGWKRTNADAIIKRLRLPYTLEARALVALYLACVAHYSLPVGCLESDWQSTGADVEYMTAAVTAILEGSETP